jgi:thiamine biosynthesis lipoprotein
LQKKPNTFQRTKTSQRLKSNLHPLTAAFFVVTLPGASKDESHPARKLKFNRLFLYPALLLWCLGCSAPEIHTVRQVRVMMDTAASIRVFLPDSQAAAQAHAAIAAAFQEMARLDSVMSFYRNDSEVSAINRWAAALPDQPSHATLFEISAEVDSVLRTALQVSRISSGAFDVTIAPLMRLWGFGTEHLHRPAAEEIRARLPLVNFRHVQLGEAALSPANGRHAAALRLLQSGMAFDLGGIAKGYIITRGIRELQRRGYRDAIVEAGGDFCAVASPLTQGQRHIWVQHPRQKDKFFASFKMDGGAVSTSGDYERFFEEGGRRYHHILDPRTGYSAGIDSDKLTTVSATVTASSAMIADAFSTAMFVLGPERAVALADSLPDIETMIIYLENGRLNWRASQELAGKLEIIPN